MKQDISYLNRQESNAIKGVLILLIILGHCHLLVDYYDTSSGMMMKYAYKKWLYDFHVLGFFILPFLYGSKKMAVNLTSLKRLVLKHGRRLLVPYFWFFLLCMIISIFYLNNKVQVQDIIHAFFSGDQFLIKEVTGFTFLWFMPTMFCLVLIKDVVYNLQPSIRLIIYILSISVWICIFSHGSYIRQIYDPYSIFGGLNAIAYSIWGIIVREIIEDENKDRRLKCICFSIFFVCSVLFFIIPEKSIAGYWINGLCRFFLPPSFIMICYYLRIIFAKSNILKTIGMYSFEIYLFHIFVFGILQKCIPININWETMDVSRASIGITIFVITIVVSLLISIILKKNSLFNKYILPR